VVLLRGFLHLLLLLLAGPRAIPSVSTRGFRCQASVGQCLLLPALQLLLLLLERLLQAAAYPAQPAALPHA
jgi:hypothetical protein